MTNALRRQVLVQPGGVIQIRSPELVPGTLAEVIVLVEKTPVSARPLSQWIGAAKGGFARPSDVDEFMRREREAWE